MYEGIDKKNDENDVISSFLVGSQCILLKSENQETTMQVCDLEINKIILFVKAAITKV